jgi:hypothetical protein
MKILVCLLLIALTGCRAFPNLEADHWVHDGHYGVATTHYEATAVKKQPDGNLHVGTYTGSVTVLGGYGVADTIQGLTITPGAPVAPQAVKP